MEIKEFEDGTFINADCMDVMKDIIKEKSVIVTDPPFNVGYKYNTYSDNMPEKDYFEGLSKLFVIPSVVIHYPESLYKLAISMGKSPERVVSWVYNSNTPRQHRDIAFFDVKPDFSLCRQPYKNLNDKRIKERIEKGNVGSKLYDWFEVNQIKNVSKEKNGIYHPCVMPIDVMIKIIAIIPREFETVIDCFSGSGTTAIACHRGKRRFVCIEKDKEYFEMSVKRYEDEIRQGILL